MLSLWRSAHRNNLVDLLGNGDASLYAACASRCARANVQTRLLVIVEDPYTYWQVVYQEAWRCIFNTCASGSAAASLLRQDHYTAGIDMIHDGEHKLRPRPSWQVPYWSQAGVLASFATFLQYAASSPKWARVTQTAHLHAKCGTPCAVDQMEVLHASALGEDWTRLNQKYPGLPQRSR